MVETNNNQIFVPRPPIKKALFLWALAIIILIAVFSFNFRAILSYLNKFSVKINQDANQPVKPAQNKIDPASKAPATPEEGVKLSLLNSYSKLKFPPIKESKSITANELPTDIALLTGNADSAGVKAQSIIYENGETGFIAEYGVGLDGMYAYEVFSNAASQGEWKLVSGQRAQEFGFIEMDASRYSLRAELKFVDGTHTQIYLQTISK